MYIYGDIYHVTDEQLNQSCTMKMITSKPSPDTDTMRKIQNLRLSLVRTEDDLIRRCEDEPGSSSAESGVLLDTVALEWGRLDDKIWTGASRMLHRLRKFRFG